MSKNSDLVKKNVEYLENESGGIQEFATKINYPVSTIRSYKSNHSFIMIGKPPSKKTSHKYIGGLGLLLEHEDNMPCIKKIIISKFEIELIEGTEPYRYIFETLLLKHDLDLLALSPDGMAIKKREEVEKRKFLTVPPEDENGIYRYIKSKMRDTVRAKLKHSKLKGQ